MAPLEIQALSKYLSNSLLDSNLHAQVYPAFTQKLHSRYLPHHWYPLEPERGSGFRAVSFDPARQDGYLDPVLCILAQLLFISPRDFRRIILKKLGDSHSSGWTIWCDPGCVSIRLVASGGELRELWGNLPSHLSHNKAGNSFSPPLALSQRPSPVQSPSSNKSRAIPILVPASGTRLSVTPATPHGDHTAVMPSHRCDPREEEELNDVQAMLTNHLQARLQLASYCSSLDDRPASRASCASSSSDGSDNSGFSSSSSSTATSVAPPGIHMTKKLSSMHHQGTIAPQLPARFIRHQSSSSFSFTTMHNLSLNSLTSYPPPVCRTASPHANQRHRHVPSSSISSTGSGRGLLVLKGGPGTVTEHSGGKVGVMGGGVLLGLPKDKQSVSVVNARRLTNRRTRTANS